MTSIVFDLDSVTAYCKTNKPREVYQAWTITARVARKLEDFRAAYACTHFIMASQLPGMDPLVATRSQELFAKEVMPRFPT